MQNRINRIKSTYIVKLDRAAWAVSCGADPCRKVVKYLVEEAGLPVSIWALRYVARDVERRGARPPGG